MQPIKQVIIIRKDLKMRRGKECTQAAHASMSFITRRLEHKDSAPVFIGGTNQSVFIGGTNQFYHLNLTEVEKEWLENSFRKVTLQVDSEAKLLEVYQKSLDAGLESHIIKDSGLTEFSEPTYTAVAIGPDYDEKIDEITKNLRLY